MKNKQTVNLGVVVNGGWRKIFLGHTSYFSNSGTWRDKKVALYPTQPFD